MHVLKNILLFIPKVLLSLLNTIWFIICFVITYILCFGMLIIWCFNYSTLRKSGTNGMFHKLFFRQPFALYKACKLYVAIWKL